MVDNNISSDDDALVYEAIKSEHRQSIKIMIILSFLILTVLGMLFFLAINFDWAWNKFLRSDAVSQQKLVDDAIQIKKATLALEANKIIAFKYARIAKDSGAIKQWQDLVDFLDAIKVDRFSLKNIDGSTFQPQSVASSYDRMSATISIPLYDASILTLSIMGQNQSRSFDFESGAAILSQREARPSELDRKSASSLIAFIHDSANRNVSNAESNSAELDRYISKKNFDIGPSGESKTLSYSDLISLVINRLLAMSLLLGVGAVSLRLLTKQYNHYTRVSVLGLAYRVAQDMGDIDRIMKISVFFDGRAEQKDDDLMAVANATSKIIESIKPKR